MQSTNAIIDGTKAGKSKSQIFEDEEKSKLLQKLLQSKNPDDYQAANKLIKTMVKEVFVYFFFLELKFQLKITRRPKIKNIK